MRFRFVALVLTVAVVLAHWDIVGVNAQEPPARTATQWPEQHVDLAALFDAVVDTVNKQFFDEAVLRQHHWSERAQAMRPVVLASSNIEDAVRVINNLLAELQISHTALYTPNDYQYYVLLDVLGSPAGGREINDLMRRRFWGSGPYYPGIGVFTRDVDGRSFVDGVLEGSPAEDSGLKFGDEILSVDGRAYSPIDAFRGKIGGTAELMVRRAAGAKPERVMTSVVPIEPVKAFGEAIEASAHVIERNGRRVGYVHVWALAESGSFARALDKFDRNGVAASSAVAARLVREGILFTPADRDALLAIDREERPKPIDFLIVDLRGRVGGNVAVAGDLLRALDGGGYWGPERTIVRSGPGTFRPMDSPSPSFRGRSALLIDAQTRSAGELVAYGYKRSGFGMLLGTNTAGAVSSGGLYAMPGDALLYLAMAAHEFDGRRLEGSGVAPDRRVERPLPYAHGADPVLDAAADLAASSGAE